MKLVLRIRAKTMHEKKDNEQQNIIIFQAKACITEIDNYFIYNEYKKNR